MEHVLADEVLDHFQKERVTRPDNSIPYYPVHMTMSEKIGVLSVSFSDVKRGQGIVVILNEMEHNELKKIYANRLDQGGVCEAVHQTS